MDLERVAQAPGFSGAQVVFGPKEKPAAVIEDPRRPQGKDMPLS